MAPTCSSFVFANSFKTGRNTSNYEGDLEYPAVQSGNLQAQVAMFLFTLATERGASAVMESPADSMIFNYEPVRAGLAARTTHVQIADGCAYSRKKFGLRSRKAYKFVASDPWISKVALRCKCPNGVHVELMTMNAEGQVTGTHHLKASQAYPPAMGTAIISAWESLGAPDAEGAGDSNCRVQSKKDVAYKHIANKQEVNMKTRVNIGNMRGQNTDKQGDGLASSGGGGASVSGDSVVTGLKDWQSLESLPLCLTGSVDPLPNGKRNRLAAGGSSNSPPAADWQQPVQRPTKGARKKPAAMTDFEDWQLPRMSGL